MANNFDSDQEQGFVKFDLDPCTNQGTLSGGVQARWPEYSLDNVFLVHNLFYRWGPIVLLQRKLYLPRI